MNIVTFAPSPLLAPYVHLIWTMKETDHMDDLIMLSPTGYVPLTIFNDASRYQLELMNGKFASMPTAALLGQHYGVINARATSNSVCATGIIFKPTALFQLYGIDMSKLTHRISDAELILGDQFSALVNQLKQQQNDVLKVELIKNYLEYEVSRADKKFVHSANVVSYMQQRNGTISIKELADHFHCSPRMLERRFVEQVGVSPKYLNRVIQFNHVLSIMSHSRELPWTEIAYLGGYYDQAHLIKAFIEFTGTSPVQYEPSRFTEHFFPALHSTHRIMSMS